ncbi:MAG: acetyl-CoA carboxylase carboxyltransferase subunit beta [Candidatus Auribacter fodinae]|jgi:acetyl-CoA carboxylase carboxyl transferase subunit beta|uniref:Acetyl-coenzyme A carboxylase carboxyl transferase subunit beta n=1 Tax=Candidatus Auribacter fodinae TaxID=2093366 RepID=A0A3A4R016_9BACT|nr:MAG: acetyl-CoA carboxylase carboxyltransferase subunit beta [Candidatus Auribacter fodinae]
MSLFGRPKYSKIFIKKKDIPQGLWEKCKNCQEIIHKRQLEENLLTCPKCNFLYPISAAARIASLVDEGTFVEINGELRSSDPLKFVDSKPYSQRQESSIKSTGLNDAIITGWGTIKSIETALGVMDFSFMGGSMGSVVGEKVTRLVEFGIKREMPVVVISASGGARMQESTLSLMQMAKTSAAIGRLREKNLPYISILTNPTTGGTTASFASLGDVIIAEPKALIGFAGPRVIQQTIKQDLPDGFQKSEFLLEHGLVDMIVDRKDMRDTLHFILSFLISGRPAKKNENVGSQSAKRGSRNNGSGTVEELAMARSIN